MGMSDIVNFATHRAYSAFDTTQPLGAFNGILDGIRNCLMSANWELRRAFCADDFTLNYPFGLPDGTFSLAGTQRQVFGFGPYGPQPATLQGTLTGPFVIDGTVDHLKLQINGGSAQTIVLTHGTRTAEQICDDIARQITGAVPVAENGRVLLSTLALGPSSSITINTVANDGAPTIGWVYPVGAVAKAFNNELYDLPPLPVGHTPDGNYHLLISIDGGATVDLTVSPPGSKRFYHGVFDYWISISEFQASLQAQLNAALGTGAGGASVNNFGGYLTFVTNDTSPSAQIEFFPYTYSGHTDADLASIFGFFEAPYTYTNSLTFYGIPGFGQTYAFMLWNSNFETVPPSTSNPAIFEIWFNIAGVGSGGGASAIIGWLIQVVNGGFLPASSYAASAVVLESVQTTGTPNVVPRSWGGGTSGNNIGIFVTSGIGVNGVLVKGGWKLLSKSQQDLDITSMNNGRSDIEVRVVPQSLSYTVWMHISLNDVMSEDFYCQQSVSWQLQANDYWAYFYGPAPSHSGDIYAGNDFVWTGSLFVPQALTTITASVFLLTAPGSPNHQLQTNGSAVRATTLYNSKQATDQVWGPGGFAFDYYYYVSSYSSSKLRTRLSKSIMVPALVQMPASPTGGDEARVAGYMWDCFIETLDRPLGTPGVQEGIRYVTGMNALTNENAAVWITWSGPIPASSF